METQDSSGGTAPNFLILITDQQRGNLHLPLEWQAANLPGMTLLRKHGLEFINGFCNTCMCSPSRSTLMTGLYPAQHGVTDTLSFGGIYSATEPTLDSTVPNLATALRPLYDPHYRGKWHVSKGGMNNVHPEKALLSCEVAVFGWNGWVAPDAGEDTKLANFGGGYADHDSRYVAEARAYLQDWKARKAADPGTKPFILVLSLVNPHDVLAYPKTYADGGYTNPDWLAGGFTPPPGYDERLIDNFKPDCQWQLLVSSALALGSVAAYPTKVNYVNFYANLVKLNDDKICAVLEEFYEVENGGFTNPKPLGESTVILRISDHGEMGMAHGGMRQKAFNAYEETLRVPYIYSNPVLVNPSGKAKQTTALAGLIDVLPTLCGIAGVPIPDGVRGHDLSGIVLGSSNERPGEVLFTFDDTKAGSNSRESVVNAANRLRCVRTQQWKYARYFEANGSYLEEYEFYYLYGQGYDQNGLYPVESPAEQLLRDLLADYPLEYVNMAYDANPLMADWPQEVMDLVRTKRAEMKALLHKKELEMLTLTNAEIHKRQAGLRKSRGAEVVSQGSEASGAVTGQAPAASAQ